MAAANPAAIAVPVGGAQRAPDPEVSEAKPRTAPLPKEIA
jgi:hypothetical protein